MSISQINSEKDYKYGYKSEVQISKDYLGRLNCNFLGNIGKLCIYFILVYVKCNKKIWDFLRNNRESVALNLIKIDYKDFQLAIKSPDQIILKWIIFSIRKFKTAVNLEFTKMAHPFPKLSRVSPGMQVRLSIHMRNFYYQFKVTDFKK